MTTWVDRVARLGTVLVLSVGVLGFGAIGLCGGWVTLRWLPNLLAAPAYTAFFLLFSVPCTIAGVIVAKACVGKMWRLMSGSSPQKDAHG